MTKKGKTDIKNGIHGERHTYIKTYIDLQKDIHTEKQTYNKTNRKKDIHTERHKEKTYRLKDIHTETKNTFTQKDRKTNLWKDRQTNKQKDTSHTCMKCLDGQACYWYWYFGANW